MLGFPLVQSRSSCAEVFVMFGSRYLIDAHIRDCTEFRRTLQHRFDREEEDRAASKATRSAGSFGFNASMPVTS